ncbi:MAG: hypothetical protein AAGD28_13350, partial [Bacteroidota bacterium]
LNEILIMQQNPIKNTYLSIVLVNSAMIAGPTVLAIVFWFIVNNKGEGEAAAAPDMSLIFQIIVVGTLCMSYVVGKLMGAKQMEAAKKAETLTKKLELYRGINILKTAMLEGAALAAMVFFFVTHDQSFIYLGLVVIGYMLATFPIQNKIAKELELSDPMQREFTKAMQS